MKSIQSLKVYQQDSSCKDCVVFRCLNVSFKYILELASLTIVLKAPKRHSNFSLGCRRQRSYKGGPFQNWWLSVKTHHHSLTGKCPRVILIPPRDSLQVLNIKCRERVAAMLKLSDLPHSLIKGWAAIWTKVGILSRSSKLLAVDLHITFLEQNLPDKREQ